MITGTGLYNIFAAVVPLYFAVLLGFASVKWWKIFTPEQCTGINRVVALFAVPLLCFHIVATNNPYIMNFRFIAGDSLQKVVILAALFLWQALSKKGSIEWTTTMYSLSTLPNNLFIGIPLMTAMYGEITRSLMVQVVVLQALVWCNILLCLFEIRAAKVLIAEQFPETAGSIASFKVESDLISLSGQDPIEAETEISDDGKLHVVLRRSSINRSVGMYSRSSVGSLTQKPQASNPVNSVEIYSVQSTPQEPYRSISRNSSFSQTDGNFLHPMFGYMESSPKHGYTRTRDRFSPYASPDHLMLLGSTPSSNYRKMKHSFSVGRGGEVPNNKQGLHMFVWSTSSSPVSDVHNNGRHAFSTTSTALKHDSTTPGGKITRDRELDLEEEANFKASRFHRKQLQMPPTSVITRLVFIMVWRKLIRNPSTYASVLGLIWSLIAFRCHIKLPTIIDGSITMISSAGMGMAQFSLGLFMALQPKFIASGKPMAAFTMVVRFLIGPGVTAATSLAVGLRGVLLQSVIVQAALPLATLPFVYAKEYDVHPDIISTTVIFGLILAVPVTIIYYVLLGL
ncbi:auxin efflux carrier component 2-like [Quercus lobata]|uniref:auxin efflux carrier component 2-like n=1 Tax=Quercus lobata TaxID=97700 RepID=UPI0012472D09|nr:auxin efflux carrier component 2-like [Quercus lobata]